MRRTRNGSGKYVGIFRQFASSFGTQAFIVNQTASSTMIKTIPPQTTGVTFFLLPLRGESFGAWLWRSSITACLDIDSNDAGKMLAEDRHHLVPQRIIRLIGIVLGWR